ncbi:MAG: hypothetical protein ACUVV0_00005 [Anaerolineae bacterium]
MLKTETIHFPNGNKALMVRVPGDGDAEQVIKALGLPRPRAVLLPHGGAAHLPADKEAQLRCLIKYGIAKACAREDILVIDGGTQAGVMAMMGEGLAEMGRSAPLLGVAPAGLVTYPGGPPVSGDIAPLEPNHSHFVLVEGDEWGSETDLMFRLAEKMAEGVLSVALLVDGGQVTRKEALYNVRRGREVIVIQGSGRVADEIADAFQREQKVENAEILEITRNGKITLFNINHSPQDLTGLIRHKLQLI